MLARYKSSLLTLFAQVHELREQPVEKARLCLEVQKTLIIRMSYVERRIREAREDVINLKRGLRQRDRRLSKAEAVRQKDVIENQKYLLHRYEVLLSVYRSIGDALAFIYVDRWDIKSLAFKERTGFLTGSTGLRREKQVLRMMFQEGQIAILNDLTNCFRYGDITVVGNGVHAVIEVKTSDNRNARTRRQQKGIEHITSYLRTDRTEQLYGREWGAAGLQRITAHRGETTQIAQLNELIYEAYQKGVSFREVEEGLFYIVSAHRAPDLDPTGDIIAGFQSTPYVFFSNQFKREGVGYYPFTLSIVEPQAIYDFYEGNLLITVMVDMDFINRRFAQAGIAWMLGASEVVREGLQDEDDAFQVALTMFTDTESESHATLAVSRHFFGRLGSEFLSLEWFLDEQVTRFKRLDERSREE